MAATAVLTGIGIFADDRLLDGVPVWSKPFKFAVSFIAYCPTLAWMLSLLPRGRRVGWWAGTVVAVTCAVEMAIITGQAARGRHSHYNRTTPLDAALFDAMAVTVVILWLAALVIAVLLLRARILDRAQAWAVRIGSLLALAGAAIGFVMTQATSEQVAAGGRDGSPYVGAHSVGVPDGGPGMAVTGWSTTGGDLRIAHFFGMHALQILPLLLLVLAALAPRFARLGDPRVRLRLVLVGSGAYAAVFALLTWQALRGQPLLRPDAVTLLAGGAALVLTVGAAAWAVRAAPRGSGAGTGSVSSSAAVSASASTPTADKEYVA
ncbi:MULTISPECIES: hypothetical protein [Streptomyces]|uniref:Integral membrane protein n=1 Tax=Streptomyces solicathayae TaxID=3081768 RepID=A0ABZ0M586_9ACTN|nr:hypothetical protein [Streptomyces sp. HUAS YS2]WOX26805.1 hypothetical protein R2D22_29975 [Streptomyces sp. HUAS YS2]